MATVKNPVLFSSYFGISPQILSKAGLIDIFLNVDTPLFVDPVLLDKSSNQLIETTGAKNVRDRFSEIVGLLAISRQHGDVAWRNAARRLDLSEPPETGLGYGSSSKSGSSRPNKIKEAILETSKEIIELGCRDPEMISLMGFLENGVGADTISDFTTHAIFENLCEITRDFCVANQIAVHGNDVSRNFKLPIYKRSNGTEHPVELTSSGTCRRRTIGAKSNKQLFRVKKKEIELTNCSAESRSRLLRIERRPFAKLP